MNILKRSPECTSQHANKTANAAAFLSVQGVSWSTRCSGKTILHPTSFELPSGRVLGIVGSNGAGKTTLLRLLYRFHRPTTGQVLLDGQDIWSMAPRRVARKMAVVLQELPTDFALTVREIVALGRVPYRSGFGGNEGARDNEMIEATLARLQLLSFADRHLDELSGGERQRVMVARALAQEPRVLILDEPTNHLDIRQQIEVVKLIRDLPLTIITTLHELNVAAGLCDDILLLKAGRTTGFGPPAAVLSEAALSDAFDVTARREHLVPSGTDHLTFHL